MGHYYDAEGNPNHYQITQSGKNKGNKRGTTIRDAKKLKLFPSVTEISSQLESNGLTTWKIRQALTHGHEIAYQHKFPDATETFISRAMGMLEEETTGYADFGTMVHEAIEKYIISEIDGSTLSLSDEEQGFIDRWNTVINSTFPDLVYLGTEVSFGNAKLGYGGSVDVIAYDRILDTFVIPDLKTKKTSPGKKPYSSERYPLQLVAYRDGFDRFDKLDFSKCPEAKDKLVGRQYGFPASDCVVGNLYISSTEDDRQFWTEIGSVDKQNASDCFDLLRRMYFLRKGYDPTKASV
jgi:hypothetical protein